jgi:hypothetical protein
VTDRTDQTTPADTRADGTDDQGKQGLQPGPDNFTDGYAPRDAGGTVAPGVVSPATAAALERDRERWDAAVSGPLARVAAEDAATARVVERMTADQDAADAALLERLADADALSPDLLAALADDDAAPVCDGDDWSTEGDHR